MPVTVDMGSRDVTIAPAQARGVVVREGPQGIQGERGPTGIQGPPGDLTKEVADATYERKLIDTAVWRVDAGAVGTDGLSLIDLSGNDRPAVFGTGPEKPLVLPYDGEPYVFSPGDVNRVYHPSLARPLTGVVAMEWDGVVLDAGSGTQHAVTTFDDWSMYINVGSQPTFYVAAPSGYSAGNLHGSTPLTVGKRHLLRAEHDYATHTTRVYLDGVLVGTKTQTGTPTVGAMGGAIGQGVAGRMQQRATYRAAFYVDGAAIAEMRPADHHTNYTKIRNTGTAGGDWTVNRAASGFKTAVVDRPLLLFGGGQYADGSDLRSLNRSDHSVVLAMRAHAGTYNYSKALSNTVAIDGWSFHTNTTGAWARNYIVRNVQSAGVYHPVSGQAVLAGVISGTEGRRFLNGVRDQTFAVAADRPDASGRWVIGAQSNYGSPAPFEFIAAAIFDRALTDTEVAKATQELLGVPHVEQPDPHPQYVLKTQQTRVSRPNGTDRLVEVWDGTAWVVAHYDSGLRQLASWDAAGNVTGTMPANLKPAPGLAGYLRIRRVGSSVQYSPRNAAVKTAASGAFLTVPRGFRIAGDYTGTTPLVMYRHPAVIACYATEYSRDAQDLNIAAVPAVDDLLMAVAPWTTPDPIPTTLPGTLITPAS